MSGDDRVQEKINAGERSDVGGRGTRRLEAVTSGGAANPTVNAGGEASAKAGEKEGGKRPLLFGDGIEVIRWVGRRQSVRGRGCEWSRPASPVRCRWREATASDEDQKGQSGR